MQLVNILYTNHFFRTKINGWLSKTVSMQRGIRQGFPHCPALALMYILEAEVLAIKIHENDNLYGFSLPNMTKEKKLYKHRWFDNALDVTERFI